jgi:hypothetical protein
LPLRGPWSHALELLLLAVLGLTGCGGNSTSYDSQPSPSVEESSAGAPEASELSRSQACDAFLETVGDFTMSDSKSAKAFTKLAQRTADPSLAAAIQRVADGFARRDPSVSASEVNSLCR